MQLSNRQEANGGIQKRVVNICKGVLNISHIFRRVIDENVKDNVVILWNSMLIYSVLSRSCKTSCRKLAIHQLHSELASQLHSLLHCRLPSWIFDRDKFAECRRADPDRLLNEYAVVSWMLRFDISDTLLTTKRVNKLSIHFSQLAVVVRRTGVHPGGPGE